MKKYIKPISKLVEIESNAILVGSDPTLHNAQGNGSWHAKGMDDDWDDEDDF